MLCELMMSNNGKKNDLYYFAEKILKKFGLPTKLKIVKKIDQKFMKGFIKEFLDKKNKNNNPRYISLKKTSNPSIKEISDYGLLNDTIFKITEIY